jgi:phage-related holin
MITEEQSIIVKYQIIIISGLLSYYTPIKHEMLFVGGLVMFDWITGLIKGLKTNNFKSSLAINKLWKSLGYFTAIMIARNIEVYLLGGVPLVKPLVAIIAVSELQSLRENLKEITGVDLLENISSIFKTKKNKQ